MARGESVIHGPLLSADTLSVLSAAEALGAKCVREANDSCWRITGCNKAFSSQSTCIDMGNSGTGLRLLSALGAVGSCPVAFDGDESLRSRPMEPLLSALKQLGAEVSDTFPITVKGPLKGGKCQVRAVSSQFLSALLFAAPFAENSCEIEVTVLNEIPYVYLTLSYLDFLGIKYTASDDLRHFTVPGGQSILAFERTVPADFSTAAFPLLAGTIAGGSAGVTIPRLDFNDPQGDKAVFDYFRQFQAQLKDSPEGIVVRRAENLTARIIDLNATPDALPAMAVLAACTPGRTELVNVPQARLKETDRIACMASELKKMGAEVEELPDGLIIQGGRPLQGVDLHGYGDHRLVMALAIALLAAEGPGSVDTAESAAVTYPDFVRDFRAAGADFTLI